MDPTLPPVDPDFMIVQRDPVTLRAYARGLLHQVRNPSREYSFDLVTAATVQLVRAYVDARLPLPPEMTVLIASVVKCKKRASTFRKVQEKNEKAYWAAIRFEASQPADRDGKAPSAATRYAVAKYVLKEGGWASAAGKAPAQKHRLRARTGNGSEECGSDHPGMAREAPLSKKRAVSTGSRQGILPCLRVKSESDLHGKT